MMKTVNVNLSQLIAVLMAILVAHVGIPRNASAQDDADLVLTGEIVVLGDITIKADVAEDGVEGVVDVPLLEGVTGTFSYDGQAVTLKVEIDGEDTEISGPDISAGIAFKPDGACFQVSMEDAVKYDLISLQGLSQDDGSLEATQLRASIHVDAQAKLSAGAQFCVTAHLNTSFYVGTSQNGYQIMVVRHFIDEASVPQLMLQAQAQANAQAQVQARLEVKLHAGRQLADSDEIEAYCCDEELHAPRFGDHYTYLAPADAVIHDLFVDLIDPEVAVRMVLVSQLRHLERIGSLESREIAAMMMILAAMDPSELVGQMDERELREGMLRMVWEVEKGRVLRTLGPNDLLMVVVKTVNGDQGRVRTEVYYPDGILLVHESGLNAQEAEAMRVDRNAVEVGQGEYWLIPSGLPFDPSTAIRDGFSDQFADQLGDASIACFVNVAPYRERFGHAVSRSAFGQLNCFEFFLMLESDVPLPEGAPEGEWLRITLLEHEVGQMQIGLSTDVEIFGPND